MEGISAQNKVNNSRLLHLSACLYEFLNQDFCFSFISEVSGLQEILFSSLYLKFQCLWQMWWWFNWIADFMYYYQDSSNPDSLITWEEKFLKYSLWIEQTFSACFFEFSFKSEWFESNIKCFTWSFVSHSAALGRVANEKSMGTKPARSDCVCKKQQQEMAAQ